MYPPCHPEYWERESSWVAFCFQFNTDSFLGCILTSFLRSVHDFNFWDRTSRNQESTHFPSSKHVTLPLSNLTLQFLSHPQVQNLGSWTALQFNNMKISYSQAAVEICTPSPKWNLCLTDLPFRTENNEIFKILVSCFFQNSSFCISHSGSMCVAELVQSGGLCQSCWSMSETEMGENFLLGYRLTIVFLNTDLAFRLNREGHWTVKLLPSKGED